MRARGQPGRLNARALCVVCRIVASDHPPLVLHRLWCQVAARGRARGAQARRPRCVRLASFAPSEHGVRGLRSVE
jgi:hypothetical protein